MVVLDRGTWTGDLILSQNSFLITNIDESGRSRVQKLHILQKSEKIGPFFTEKFAYFDQLDPLSQRVSVGCTSFNQSKGAYFNTGCKHWFGNV